MKEEKPSQTEIELNYQRYKETSIFYGMVIKQMVRNFVKKCPRDILIDVLKSEKIIKQDWNQKGEKYVERK